MHALVVGMASTSGATTVYFLFTSDENSMCTNMVTDHAIEVIGSSIEELSSQPSFLKNFFVALIIEEMKIIMKTVRNLSVLHNY